MKLKYKLPLYYTVIWVICVVSFSFLSFGGYNIINNSVQKNFTESAKSISYNIDWFLNEKVMDIKTLTKNNTIINNVYNNKLLQQELNDYILINNAFNYIEISNDSWEIVWRSDVIQRTDTDYFYIVDEEKIWDVKKTKIDENDLFSISDVKRNEFWQQSIDIIFSSIEIWNKKYNFLWNLKTDFIDKIVKGNFVWNKWNFLLVNELDEIIYTISNTEISYDDKIVFWETISSLLNNSIWNTWKIIIKQPNREAFQNVSLLWIQFVGLILFIIFAIIFLIVVIFRNFTFPLARLLKTVKEIADCDTLECTYFTDLDTKREDELWFLAKSFNKMLDNIRSNGKILQEYKWLIDESSLVSKYGLDGKINYVNDTFCEVSEYPRNKLLKKTMDVVKHEDTSKKVLEQVWDTINVKKIWKWTIKFKKQNWEPYWASMIVAPILDVNDKIVEFISIWHDITELEKTRDELKWSYEQLKDSTDKLIEKERIGKEFELAEQIQNDFLPKLNEVNIEGLDMYFWIKSATEIGWDLYDVITQKSDTNKILFYIWDVTGHGLISWMMMAVCNTLLYWLANTFVNLTEILKILNSTLFHKLPAKVFITMLLLQYDVKKWIFSYLWAWHEKILIYRKKADAIEEIKSGWDAIWMFKNTKRDIKTTDLKLNLWDIILLYTDWITEARNKKWDFYWLEKLKESFKANAHRQTEALYDSMQKDLLDYVGDAEIVDDITMFLIKKD